VRHLPPESATARHYNPEAIGWDVTSYLVSDLYHALTGEQHPARPTREAKRSRYADLRARLEAQRARTTTAPASE
jgi:hypothetical protein